MRKSATILLLFAATILWAKDPRVDPQNLLARSADAMNLEAAGKPFLIKASGKVFLEPDKQLDVKYQWVWEAPNRWRKDFNAGNFILIALRDGNTIWRARSLNYIPVVMQQFLEAVPDTPTTHEELQEIEIRGVHEKKIDGTATHCLDLGYKHSSSRSWHQCFDDANGFLMKTEYKELALQYSQFEPFDGKAYPRRIVATRYGKIVAEVSIENIAYLQQPHPEIFKPPADAKPWPWCDDLKPPHVTATMDPFHHFSVNSAVAVSFVVTEEGRVRDLVVATHSTPEFNQNVTEFYTALVFQPATCNGKAIPFLMDIWF